MFAYCDVFLFVCHSLRFCQVLLSLRVFSACYAPLGRWWQRTSFVVIRAMTCMMRRRWNTQSSRSWRAPRSKSLSRTSPRPWWETLMCKREQKHTMFDVYACSNTIEVFIRLDVLAEFKPAKCNWTIFIPKETIFIPKETNFLHTLYIKLMLSTKPRFERGFFLICFFYFPVF